MIVASMSCQKKKKKKKKDQDEMRATEMAVNHRMAPSKPPHGHPQRSGTNLDALLALGDYRIIKFDFVFENLELNVFLRRRESAVQERLVIRGVPISTDKG